MAKTEIYKGVVISFSNTDGSRTDFWIEKETDDMGKRRYGVKERTIPHKARRGQNKPVFIANQSNLKN